VGTLAGRTALVAGGANGIGAATARVLAARGATVVVGDREHERGAAVATEVGGRFVPLDVTDPAAWAAVEPVDLAYLSAGVMTRLDPVTLADLTPANWERVRAVNVDGALHGVFHLVPGMRARGGGAIVLTGSLAGFVAFPDDPFYAAAKASLISLGRSLAGPLGEAGVRINVICPGEVDTAMLPAQRASFLASRGYRPLRPEEVAAAVADTLEGDDTGQVFTLVAGRPREPYPFGGVPRPVRETQD